jgi:hypothetical protein
LDPELATIRGNSKETRAIFIKLIKKAWEELGQDYFNGLIWLMDL